MTQEATAPEIQMSDEAVLEQPATIRQEGGWSGSRFSGHFQEEESVSQTTRAAEK
jgi:hypothetical protein